MTIVAIGSIKRAVGRSRRAAREARDSRRGVRGVCVSAGGRGWKDVPLVGRGVTGQEGMA